MNIICSRLTLKDTRTRSRTLFIFESISDNNLITLSLNYNNFLLTRKYSNYAKYIDLNEKVEIFWFYFGSNKLSEEIFSITSSLLHWLYILKWTYTLCANHCLCEWIINATSLFSRWFTNAFSSSIKRGEESSI